MEEGLGVLCSSNSIAQTLACVKLSDGMICTTAKSQTVQLGESITFCFESCLSTTIVPGNFLAGPIENLLSFSLHLLLNEAEYGILKLKIILVIKNNSLPSQNRILK